MHPSLSVLTQVPNQDTHNGRREPTLSGYSAAFTFLPWHTFGGTHQDSLVYLETSKPTRAAECDPYWLKTSSTNIQGWRDGTGSSSHSGFSSHHLIYMVAHKHLIPSSRLLGYQASIWYTDIYLKHPYTHFKKKASKIYKAKIDSTKREKVSCSNRV